MQHPDVRAWLDQADPSYAAGLLVLASTGYDQTSITWSLLQRGADSFTRSKLRELLEAALGSPSQVAPVSTDAVPAEVANPNVATAPRGGPSADRPGVATPGLNPAIPPLLDQRTEAKARLRAILDDDDKAEERRVLALGIKDVTDQLDRLYQPEAFVTTPPRSRNQTTKKGKVFTLANVRTYVSLYRRHVRNEPDNAAYARLLAYYETLLKQLQSTNETI